MKAADARDGEEVAESEESDHVEDEVSDVSVGEGRGKQRVVSACLDAVGGEQEVVVHESDELRVPGCFGTLPRGEDCSIQADESPGDGLGGAVGRTRRTIACVRAE